MQYTLKHVADDRELERVSHHRSFREVLVNVNAKNGAHLLISLQVLVRGYLLFRQELFTTMRAPDSVEGFTVERFLSLVVSILADARVLKHLILPHVVYELL